MTGTGTEEDPYIISDVDDLQAVEDDLDAYYELGGDIDASATSGWNDGAGFDPIGGPITTFYSYATPYDDLEQGGYQFGAYPDDDIYYDKVDDPVGSPDDDATYIWEGGATPYFIFQPSILDVDVPNDAYDISVSIYMRATFDSTGTNELQAMLRFAEGDYKSSSGWNPPTYGTYGNHYWTWTTDPRSGAAWEPLIVNTSIQGIGVCCDYGNAVVLITQLYMRVSYKRDLRFMGKFGGKDYTISDLFINRPTENYVGLFGYTHTATVQDCTLEDVNITGADNVGSLVGMATESTITDLSSSGDVTGDEYIGGLGGDLTDSTISDSSSSVDVTGTNYVGGLIGLVRNDTINEVYATGDVSGTNYLGGLFGFFWDSASATDVYARGDVSGNSYIGGLIGHLYDGTLDNSYSTGLVTGNTNVGGLIGSNNGTVTNSFWDTETSGQDSSAGGTGKTTEDMKALATFFGAGWNIQQTTTNRNDGYPFLSWEIDESETIWLIYGDEDYGYYEFDFPDLMDDKGRYIKGATVNAYRTDTHQCVEEERTDEYGTCTFDELPVGQDLVFHATWGGTTIPASSPKEEWFFLRVNDIEDGGTGAATVAKARENLGVDEAGLIWELVFGD